MAQNDFFLNVTENIRVFVADANGGVDVSAVNLTIQRDNDEYLNPPSTWASSPTLIPMDKVGAVDSKGKWVYPFNANGFPKDNYNFVASEPVPTAGVINMPQIGEISVGQDMAEAAELAGSNMKGRAEYDAGSSEQKTFSYKDDRLLATSDMKDSLNQDAEDRPAFKKIPK